ncbi:Bromodomain-containing protein [Sistotremastrum niveocremeum HHB9708]|uniref:Bromodomain-containing protein n=1 Tax=Sistotremastrum niveocremeum HHB9708 TaxID=1314777 RepID=A0A164UEH3_9AGAM|nr:Bromodomain-containing protein [Sistotremastrum niveocremeum HHB9708]
MVSKRAPGIDPSNIIGGSRGKRRKGEPSPVQSKSPSPEPEDVEMEDATLDEHEDKSMLARDIGLQLWNFLKEAKSKDDRQLSYEFLRLPSRKLYPDYYTLIQYPISFEEIKIKLNKLTYTSPLQVKQDFETCFKNAKNYNMKGSPIWNDAKALLKLTSREYEALMGTQDSREDEDQDMMVDGGHDGDASEGEQVGSKKKKKKRPSFHRVMRKKLQKLVQLTDNEGRILSSDFMEPPSKKLYPVYYKMIKRVMWFNFIFKKLDAKEYQSAAECAADVELIFSNAFQFNEDHSPIWEAAMTLKKAFAKSMADLPEEYSVPEYSQTASENNPPAKLKLRINPSSAQLSKHSTTPAVAAPSGRSSNITLRLPAASTSASVAPPTQTLPTPSPAPVKAEPPPVVQTPVKAPVPTPTPAPPPPPPPREGLRPKPPPAAEKPKISVQDTAPAPVLPPPPPPPKVLQLSHSPVPPEPPSKCPLQSLKLRTVPRGRYFQLQRSEGVRIWTVRLGRDENSVRVSSVEFVPDDESDPWSSDEEEADKKVRKKVKVKPSDKERSKSKESRPKEEVIVRINGSAVKSGTRSKDPTIPEWDVALVTGMNTLEVMGDTAGEIWKVYLERLQVS